MSYLRITWTGYVKVDDPSHYYGADSVDEMLNWSDGSTVTVEAAPDWTPTERFRPETPNERHGRMLASELTGFAIFLRHDGTDYPRDMIPGRLIDMAITHGYLNVVETMQREVSERLHATALPEDKDSSSDD